jgi:hypothetical protein
MTSELLVACSRSQQSLLYQEFTHTPHATNKPPPRSQTRSQNRHHSIGNPYRPMHRLTRSPVLTRAPGGDGRGSRGHVPRTSEHRRAQYFHRITTGAGGVFSTSVRTVADPTSPDTIDCEFGIGVLAIYRCDWPSIAASHSQECEGPGAGGGQAVMQPISGMPAISLICTSSA